MSLLRRMNSGDQGHRKLLQKLLEKLDENGQLKASVEAILQDEASDIKLSDEERVRFDKDPVSFLQQIVQPRKSLRSSSRHNATNTQDNTKSEIIKEVQEEITRRAEADSEIRLLMAEKDYAAIRERTRTLFNDILAERGEEYSRSERTRLFEMVTVAVSGYGPLEPLLSDSSITEIRVLSWNQIWVAAPLRQMSTTFDDPQHLVRVLDRLVTQFGVTLDFANPSVHFKTPDGTRITMMIPPISPAGPVLMIRKYKYGSYLSMQDLIRFGTIDAEAMQFLSACVPTGLNILITGEAFTGKTTLTVVLGNLIPNDEFIVVLDNDIEEGALPQEQVLHLQTRPPGLNGLNEINKSHLIQQVGTMIAERVLVGDLDGNDINEVIRTSIPWLATMRAYSVNNALSKIQSMIRSTRGDVPIMPLLVSEAIDLIVHLEQLRSGQRRVGQISEVLHQDGEFVVHDIFSLKIKNQYVSQLEFVNRPVGEQFNVPEIKKLFEDKL